MYNHVSCRVIVRQNMSILPIFTANMDKINSFYEEINKTISSPKFTVNIVFEGHINHEIQIGMSEMQTL